MFRLPNCNAGKISIEKRAQILFAPAFDSEYLCFARFSGTICGNSALIRVGNQLSGSLHQESSEPFQFRVAPCAVPTTPHREPYADKKDSHQRTQALKPPARGGSADHLRGRGRDEVAWLVEMTGVGDSFYSRSSVTFTSHWCASVASPLMELRANPATVTGPASKVATP